MTQPTTRYSEKARESLAGADSEYVNGRYNLTARPFNWKFTPSDLLRRISEREQQATTQQTDLAEAA